MNKALSTSGLNVNEINHINVHGTATENNDLTESIALKRIFGDSVPSFVSTKANTGHTLGAAGAIEAVYSILNIQFQEIYPQINFENAIIDTGLIPNLTYQKTEINHVMSNSFGFGGNCASLIFSKL